MNINASIIDQRLSGIENEIQHLIVENELHNHDAVRLRSIAFVYLCVKTLLDLDVEKSFDCLTEGGGDFGVDALHLSEEVDGEFGVTLFQGKYKRSLDGTSNFPQSGIESMIRAIRHIFDPSANLGNINDRLMAKVEEARSLIRDGVIPRVRAIACNNGLKWNGDAQAAIERADFGGQVTWEHINHDTIVKFLLQKQSIDAILRLSGKAIVEDMNFSRVCIGRIPVAEIATLMKTHGDRLLERNIRRYLGLHSNRVNEGIQATLKSTAPENFYLFNNGLTFVCDQFTYNALQQADFQIKVTNLQIVNGGQSAMTIYKLSEELEKSGEVLPAAATVLVRLYELSSENNDIVRQITHATNSQNPVDLKDLRSNDLKQKQLEESIKSLGYTYRRKRMDSPTKPTDITAGAAAEAILAVWRRAPHQAKFFTREHFGKLYDVIFDETLNGAQVVLAVLLYRMAENHRRRPHESDPQFVRYASCFIAMQMGRYLLADKNLELDGVNHQNFEALQLLIEEKGEKYFQSAVKDIEEALNTLYGEEGISMQQLSATFRRGDLIEILKK